jgi:sulfate permease, SulP family
MRGFRLAPGLHPFRPRLFGLLAAYDRRLLAADLTAGATVGVIALPLAMAFAIASGVKPEAGIFTAIIAGFLVSALGGSRVQIGGPAGAFIVIVYGIVQHYGLANLFAATMLAGVLLFAMGLTGIGSLVRLIPVPIIIGFTNGIAVLIMLSQVKDLFGLKIDQMPADFPGAVRAIAGAAETLSLPTLALGAVSLAVIAAWPRIGHFLDTMRATGAGEARAKFVSRLPGTIVVLVLATAASALLQLPVETIGTRFGGIAATLPAFALPELSWSAARNLVAPTLTIAILGAIESLLCARIADAMIDDRHDPNQELMAQGIANFVTPLFGGIPATGTIARTSANVRLGARTPVAGMVHAAALLAIVLVAAPLARHVPLATLAAILLFVAWNMGEWHEFRRLMRLTVPYSAIMVSTFLLTVVVDLTVAVEIGLVLAALLFIYRMSSLTMIEKIEQGARPEVRELPAGVAVYRVYGALFFGAVGKLETLVEAASGEARPRVLILDLHKLIHTDTSGIDTLDVIRRALAGRGSTLMICDVNRQPLSLMGRSGFLQRLGADNVQPHLQAAIARATALL